ncbi:MAG: hypothetical protein ACRDP6_12950 [Actinoallomurus sp.]
MDPIVGIRELRRIAEPTDLHASSVRRMRPPHLRRTGEARPGHLARY